MIEESEESRSSRDVGTAGGNGPSGGRSSLVSTTSSLSAQFLRAIREFRSGQAGPRILLGCLAGVGLLTLSFFWISRGSESLDVNSIPSVSMVVDAPVEVISETSVSPIVVHVAGEVAQPGLVTLSPGDRVAQAIDLAGGPTDLADLHQLNLALVLSDGTSITVPGVEEEVHAALIRSGADDSSSPDQGEATATVNINTADSLTLQRLPGVGPATGDAIIEWRSESGPFRSVDDLLLVPGIGPAKLEAMRGAVVV